MKKGMMYLCMFCILLLFSGSDIHSERQAREKLEERIIKYKISAAEIKGFPAVTEPRVRQETSRPHPNNPTYKKIKQLYPESDFTQVKFIRTAQEMTSSAKTKINVPVAKISVICEHYEDSRLPILLVNPHNNSVSSIAAFSKTTFSKFPLGEECWSAPSEKNMSKPSVPKLSVADKNILLSVQLEKQYTDPHARDIESLIVSEDEMHLLEFVARLALSKAYMAIHDFDNLKKDSATINKAKVATKSMSDKVSLVPIKSLAKQLNWKHEENYGVLTLNTGKNKVVIPAGSRELLMGSRKEKLPLPVILDGKEYWVEKNALLRLIQ